MGKDDTKKTSAEKVDRVDKALQKFADMMIQRMEEIQKDWKKGWTDGFAGGGLPQNLSGRPYVGSNAFLLYLHTSMRHFTAPVYMTIKQIREAGAKIKKGEGSVPVFKWGFSIKDENGKKVSETDYRAMSQEEQSKCNVRPYLKVYNEWNIDQTNLAEVNREKYDAILNKFKPEVLQDESGMYKNAALDRMFERQEWVCPIEYNQINPGAYYSSSFDKIVLPRKNQFKISTTPEDIYKDGMEYYGTAVHEMAHSTGHKDRLNRLENGRFGSPTYAKEELVAELTSALVGTSLGFDNRIRDNNAAYLKSWISTLRQEPKFIVSVMSDVNKASKMVLENIDKQRIALGEKALLDGNLDGEEERIKNEKDMEATTKKTEDNNVKQVVYQQAENMSTKGSSDAESRKESSYIQAYVESMTDKENIMSGNYELLPSESKAGKLSQEVLRLSKEYDNYIKNPSEYDYEDRAELFADIEASNLALRGELLKQIESFRKLSPSIHEDSNIQTDVASKAKQIAATGVPIGEAEKKAKNIVNEEVNDDENKKVELSEEEKKRKGEIKLNDEHNKKKEVEQQAEQEKPDPVIKATAHALLIVSALQTAQKNNGIWMNKDSKPGAEIINSQTPVTAYNSIMMNLYSESNGYRTNLYSYYNSAKANGMPVKRNQSALPFSWTDWDYQSRSDEKVIIGKQEYDKLPEAEKGLYVKHASHVMQNIYNIDQTTMSATNKDAYSEILKLKGAKEEPKESSLESNIKFVETFKKDNPEVLLLVKADNYYKAYKEDAEKVSEVLDLELTRSNKIKEEDGKGLRTAKFSREMLDFNLPKLIRAGNRVAISDARDLRLKNNSEEADKIVNAAIDCAKTIASKVGIKIHRSGISPNINYEPNVDRMLITSKKLSPQSTYSESIDRSCNIYRCLVQAVGRENRLDRIGRSQNLPLKAEVYDSLIQELAAGAMMARKGLQAKIARENMDYIPVWAKALNDNPKLVRVVEKDVNTTIETLDKIGLGQDVDFAAIRGEKPLIATPQHKPVDIVKFQAIKDEVGHYAFFIKPKNEPSFCVYPKREHLSTFFSVLKSDKRDETHKALATKYYDLATKYPDMKKDLITPRKVDYDTSVITSASITSSAQDSKIKLLFATINGKRETAVITPSQWQKMWLADDMGAYKKALAADVFESLIKKEIKQDNNEDVEKAQTISRHR